VSTISRDEESRADTIERILAELLQLEREITEQAYVLRSDALERVHDAVRRLGEIGSPEGILDRAAEELGAGSRFDRVLISEVIERTLRPRSIWSRERQDEADSALRELRDIPISLEYPLIEDEVVKSQRVEIVSVHRAGPRAVARLAAAIGWSSYVVAPLTGGGKTVGLMHADTSASGRELAALDAEVAAQYTAGLAGVFERAVLRETLRLHREELQAAVRWMSGRLGQLAADDTDQGRAAAGPADPALVDALTARELEVLHLLARGQTNLSIANALVVREGTVKYHVKNILRKLGATSRADAVSRYVRATGQGGGR
jgi:DNA-binding CsgD family transcriptional regulator